MRQGGEKAVPAAGVKLALDLGLEARRSTRAWVTPAQGPACRPQPHVPRATFWGCGETSGGEAHVLWPSAFHMDLQKRCKRSAGSSHDGVGDPPSFYLVILCRTAVPSHPQCRRWIFFRYSYSEAHRPLLPRVGWFPFLLAPRSPHVSGCVSPSGS